MGDGRTNTENRKENILTQSRADQSANIFYKDKNTNTNNTGMLYDDAP